MCKHKSRCEKTVLLCSVASVVSHFLTPCTEAHQAPLSYSGGFSRRESWSGLPCPLPGYLPHPGIELVAPMTPTWQVYSLPTEPSGKPPYVLIKSAQVYSLKVYKIKCKLVSMSHAMFCSKSTSPHKMKMVECITKALKFCCLLKSHFTVLFRTTTHLYVQATLTLDCSLA